MSTFTSSLRSPLRCEAFCPAILLANQCGRFDCTFGKRHFVPSGFVAQALKKIKSRRISRREDRLNAGRGGVVNRARLAGAERGAEILLERADDSRRESGELCVGQRGLRALKRYADHQRELTPRNLAAAKEIGRFNTLQFRNGQ